MANEEIRKGCCDLQRKACSYHEGWLDALDAEEIADRRLEARVQSLLSAGDAVVELLAEDWDGADGLIGRAATLTAAWEQAKGAGS